MVPVLTVLFVLAVCGSVGSGGVGPDSSPTAAPVRSVLDLNQAKSSQQRHLEVLFNRYGENGSITVSGLKRLLKNIGLDRIRNVTVQHTEHAGHHEDHQGHGHHTHNHHAHGLDPSKAHKVPTVERVTVEEESPDHLHQRAAGLVLDPSRASHGHDHGDHDHGDHDHGDHDHGDHDHGDHDHQVLGCQNASSILWSHGMVKDVSMTVEDFAFVCPALLGQIDDSSCIQHKSSERHSDEDHHHHHPAKRGTAKAAWIGGFLSIVLISLLSLLAVVLIRIMGLVFFQFLLSFLVALAVGALSGDALLHLLPYSQGTHQHLQEDPADQDDQDSVWKGLTALSGVYLMFLIEHFLTLAKLYKDRKQKKKEPVDPDTLPPLMKATEDKETNGDYAPRVATNGVQECGVAEEEQVMLAAPSSSYTAEDCENKCHSHLHDTVGTADSEHHHHHNYHHILHHHHSQNHHPHSHAHSYSQQQFQDAGLATVAWMVIMGDGLHNFTDGLAIGAAFTKGLASGLSTSVAVFCHKLPHELGDFALLLKSGMTVRQAMLYNLLSAMIASLGLVVGLLIGQYAPSVCMWVFALTAGLFLYVSLVDMVPEMLHNGDVGHCSFFFLQNVGILLGFSIILLIAVFEDKIQL